MPISPPHTQTTKGDNRRHGCIRGKPSIHAGCGSKGDKDTGCVRPFFPTIKRERERERVYVDKRAVGRANSGLPKDTVVSPSVSFDRGSHFRGLHGF